jgi:uncharacterized protein YodC (DUF2158 family)
MESNFVVGQVVRFKSGGPAMTVKEVGQQIVICSWWSSSKEAYIKFEFDPKLLETSKADPVK